MGSELTAIIFTIKIVLSLTRNGSKKIIVLLLLEVCTFFVVIIQNNRLSIFNNFNSNSLNIILIRLY